MFKIEAVATVKGVNGQITAKKIIIDTRNINDVILNTQEEMYNYFSCM